MTSTFVDGISGRNGYAVFSMHYAHRQNVGLQFFWVFFLDFRAKLCLLFSHYHGMGPVRNGDVDYFLAKYKFHP